MKGKVILTAGCTMLLAFGVGSPAFADNGPHKSTTNVMNEDRCAGCHRAHTASAAYLLTDDQDALCETCHGAAADGSKLDVLNGIGYTDSARATAAGALRGGGFDFALIGSGGTATQPVISRNVTVGGVTGPLVPALATTAVGTASTTSQHQLGTGTAWGGGGAGAGTSIALECGSCHDPHGGANAGYGTYRILKVNPNTGVMVGQVQTVTGTAASAAVTITSVAATGVAANQIITLSGVTPSAYNATYQVVSATGTAITANAVTIARSGLISLAPFATAPGTYVSGGAILTSAGVLSTVTGAVVNATDPVTVTYTISSGTGLVNGQVVSINGMNGTTLSGGLNITGKIVSSTATTITVQANPASSTPSGTYASAGWLTLSNTAVQDSSTYSYTTTNYWAQDDLNNATEPARDSNGALLKSSGATQTVTSLENNISRWCTTCHTRLLAGSGSYKTALTAGGTADAMYSFRHRSDANTNGAAAGKAMGDSPNCLTCHVSHGSNADMSGTNSSKVLYPGDTGLPGSSFLLRVDNRGTCQMCHNK